MKKFQIPLFYNSNIIDQIRRIRELQDPRKKDLSPSLIKIDRIHIYIGRHFGFCYGVKNAIEICYQTIEKYPNKRIFLLSQMIHNQAVNEDLLENGVSFIMDTHGNQLINWDNINKEDIVILNPLLKIDSFKKRRNEDINSSFLSEMGYLFKIIKEKGQISD